MFGSVMSAMAEERLGLWDVIVALDGALIFCDIKQSQFGRWMEKVPDMGKTGAVVKMKREKRPSR